MKIKWILLMLGGTSANEFYHKKYEIPLRSSLSKDGNSNNLSERY
jgi:hypothetical protein